MGTIVDPRGVEQMIELLRAEGRTVIGPTVVDGTITPAEIETSDDLPIGWADDQEAGRYRVVETQTDEWFASSSPSDSWKRFLSPPEALLIRSKRTDQGLAIESAEPERHEVAFFGIRSCDLAAIAILDRVFLAPGQVDPIYERRRSDVFVVAAACAHPGNLCFCVSMDTGPSPTTGFDVAVTEIWTADRHEFLVTTGSERGRALVDRIPGRPATADDLATAAEQHDRAAAQMGRQLDPADPPLVAATPDHAGWADVGERCLACGNCTMVCPTCYCNSMSDRSDLVGDETERWRVWDSCFNADFSGLHGTPVRERVSDRYRQWLLHKLVTWHDQYGTSGCVGCGRCISACPVGIDLTAEVRAMAGS